MGRVLTTVVGCPRLLSSKSACRVDVTCNRMVEGRIGGGGGLFFRRDEECATSPRIGEKVEFS
jgi:hypothetical protein